MKAFKSIIVALALLAMTASLVFAGGDKNHGDKGKGNVIQNQIRK